MAAWVDLATFRAFVGNASTNDDAVLQVAINLACGKVDKLCGPTITTACSEHVKGNGFSLALAYRAASITSLATWPWGEPLDPTIFVAEGQLISRKDGLFIVADLTVGYNAGAATAPDWAIGAACLIGNQYFKSRLRPSLADPSTMAGFLVPNQAKELMEDYLLASAGFA